MDMESIDFDRKFKSIMLNEAALDDRTPELFAFLFPEGYPDNKPVEWTEYMDNEPEAEDRSAECRYESELAADLAEYYGLEHPEELFEVFKLYNQSIKI